MNCVAYRIFAGLIFCAFLSVMFTNLAVGELWVEMPGMLTVRADFGSVLIDGKIYVFGGITEAGARSETIESYDLATKTWTKESIMVRARYGLTVSAVDGKIYGIGGLRATYVAIYSIVQVYDPLTKKWSSKEDIPTPRHAFSSSMVDGKIYAIGGLIDGGQDEDGNNIYESTSILEVYDPATDTWIEKDSMPTERYGLSTSVVDGKIYAVGGFNDGNLPLATVEMYDPVTDRWTRKADMPTARYGLGTSVADRKIYAIGGYGIGNIPLATVEMYNPIMDTWEEKKSMPTARGDLSTIAVAGRIYAIGGVGISDETLSTMEEYTPEGWPFSVSPRGKLTTMWGNLKKSR